MNENAKGDHERNRPLVVVLGAGFGGLACARRLANTGVDALIIDRNNYHTFTPLLYQVATCALDPGEIAFPIRPIFRDSPNVRSLMADVVSIVPAQKSITVRQGEVERDIEYDFLVVALGSTTAHLTAVRGQAGQFVLRTLDDAIALRNHVLRQFEAAAWEADEAKRAALLTLVVVGGGPTGIETAGALFELYNHVLSREFHNRILRARVVLVEAEDHLLASYPEKLRRSAAVQLKTLGVEVLTGTKIRDSKRGRLVLDDDREISAGTVVWSMGVRASELVDQLGLPAGANNRVAVTETLLLTDYPEIFVVGDSALLGDGSGRPYPMMIPPAMQQGKLAAENILATIGEQPLRKFVYKDRGMMATIGRRRAVAYLFNRVSLSGWLAWIVWLLFHLLTLLGFRNRINVLVNWIWNYLTYDRGVRIVLD